MNSNIKTRFERIRPEEHRGVSKEVKCFSRNREVYGLTLCEIRCPVCNSLLAKAYTDYNGHIELYCKKCKKIYMARPSVSFGEERC